MKILVSSAHYHLSDRYGSEAIWPIEIINEYIKLGHDVTVVAGVLDVKKPLNINVCIKYMATSRSSNPVVETLRKVIYPFYSLITCLKIIISENRSFDVIHHIGPYSPSTFDLLFMLKPTKSKYIIGPVMTPPQNGPLSDFARVLGTKPSLTTDILSLGIRLVMPLGNILCRMTLSKTDLLIAVTTEARESYLKISKSPKIIVLPAGISIEKFKNNTNASFTGKLKIIDVAYFTRRKGIDILVLAAEHLVQNGETNFHVSLVGYGEEEFNLKSLVTTHNLSGYFSFEGFVENSQLQKYYSVSSVFCSPTRYEPFGVSLIEAMAAGLPVIASDVNSVKEIVGVGV